MQKLFRKLKRALFNSDASFCDMHDDARASRAAREYLESIRRHLRAQFGERLLSIVDAGCQAGRLLIPLAADGHRLIGIDTSEFALRRARQHARERGLSVTVHRGTIAQIRRWVKPAGVDAVICAEVLYLCPDYRDILKQLAASLVPGGLLIVSHRPPAFYVALAALGGDGIMARSILDRIEGPSSQGTYYNWQTVEQLQALYAELGLDLLECSPIDYDERSLKAPVQLNGGSARLPEFLELDAHRIRTPSYLLVIARKPST